MNYFSRMGHFLCAALLSSQAMAFSITSHFDNLPNASGQIHYQGCSGSVTQSMQGSFPAFDGANSTVAYSTGGILNPTYCFNFTYVDKVNGLSGNTLSVSSYKHNFNTCQVDLYIVNVNGKPFLESLSDSGCM